MAEMFGRHLEIGMGADNKEFHIWLIKFTKKIRVFENENTHCTTTYKVHLVSHKKYIF